MEIKNNANKIINIHNRTAYIGLYYYINSITVRASFPRLESGHLHPQPGDLFQAVLLMTGHRPLVHAIYLPTKKQCKKLTVILRQDRGTEL